MEKCCCCSLRAACVMLGLLAMSMIFDDGKALANHANMDEQQKKAEVDALYIEMMNKTEIEKDAVRKYFKLNFYITITDIILCMGIVGATACLFYGVTKKEDKFLLPLIWFLPFDLLVRCSFVFVLVIKLSKT